MSAAIEQPRRVRVVHMIQNLNYGGMERLIAEIVTRVDAERIESHILCLQYLGRFSEGLQEAARLHTARAMTRLSLLRPAALIAQLAALRPDVVHTHSGVWYKSACAARAARVPLVIHTEHGRHFPDPLRARIIDRLAARQTDTVVAVSEPLARALCERRIAAPGQIRTIPNGVDTDRFQPRGDTLQVRRELGLAPDTPIIGSVGRMQPIKGTDVMLEAFIQLRRTWTGNHPPVLVIGGEGPLRGQLEDTARAAGLADQVHLLGWRDDIHDLHSAFTLFTLSSRSEGTSVSMLEAMSAGLCPVVTDVGGNAAVLGPALEHRLVPSERPDLLAQAWRTALENRAQREADAVAARQRVINAFGIGAMIRGYQDLYLGVGSHPRIDRAAAMLTP